jgi:hypothetical protein
VLEERRVGSIFVRRSSSLKEFWLAPIHPLWSSSPVLHLSSHDGFLFLPNRLYFLLDPDQFLLLYCSFDFLSFLVLVLHLFWSNSGSPWMTWTGEGSLSDVWCGAPPLVWVELASLPFWLEHAAVVDMLTSCSWTCGMVWKVGCSSSSTMVEKAWVDGWWVWFWSEVWVEPSSR